MAQAKRILDTKEGQRQLRIYAAGVDFWTYCTLKAPDFYKPDRLYLKDICDQLQDFADSDDEVLVLNAPPRHGKSRTISLFTSWILGRKPTLKVMTGSYNEMLSTTFSKSVRDTIQEIKANPDTPVFSDIFPGVQIKRGDAAMNLWSLKAGHNNYLATSPTGTATGFGADCFPAGTMISTPYGEYTIETVHRKNIRQTLSLSHKSGKIEIANIVASRRKMAHEFTTVTTESGREIESTSDHRFYTEERGYVRASDLQRGETLKTLSRDMFGKAPQNEKIIKVTTFSKEEIVYDIQVDEHHNFFANGVLVHNCIMIDDLIKSSLEANTDTALEAHAAWFFNTMLSRLEEGGKIIIVMTRWSTKDLAGRVLAWCNAEHKRYRHISYKAHQGGGKMLCPQILSYKSYLSKASAMSRETVRANYDQEPLDVRGKLYGDFKIYSALPVDVHGQSLLQDIRSYTDTADEGDDYLCQMIYGVHDKYAYILDIYYTKEPMETTEAECARRLAEWRARTAVIESNNGGRGFARQVKAHLQRSKWPATEVRTFTQRRNKKARIISNATTVMQRILMPAGWQSRWPDYYDAMAQYQREGTNAHDDAPDTTTGVVEDLLGITGATAQEDRYKAVKALGL